MNEKPIQKPQSTGKPAVRPRHAATLILVRDDGDEPQVLMGLRHARHDFMPDVYVFPGGRVDRADHRIMPATMLRPSVEEKLAVSARKGSPKALALAVIRETFEETGLVVGRPARSPGQTRSAPWQAYFDAGAEPALDRLEFIARAITPPWLPKRFDTRFFMADASAIHSDLHDTSGASGELLDVRWLTFEETRSVDLPDITRVILKEVETRLQLSAAEQAARPIPFYYFSRGGRRREYI